MERELAMSSTAVCSNKECREAKSERRRKGWRLRNGDHAELCDRCASAFEEGKFCDTFHSHVAGWRSCESCLKPVHCGCIMSAHTFVLLDDGGIHCIDCVRKTSVLTQNPVCPPSLVSPIYFSHLLKDPSVRNWNHNTGTGSVPLWQSTQVLTCSAQTEVQPSRSCLGFNHEETNSLASVPCSDTENRIGASITELLSMPLTGNPLGSTSNYELKSSGKTHVRNAKVRADISSSHSQLFSWYCPNISDKQLHQISGDSNSGITPLFEKMLSASDAGRVGRLVLPKKCAETYFPPISDPEGLPLRVQDVKGQEWTFQFRFWPNNHSRMYVLEGITPCIQSLELQAGDTVTFSRLEPNGKLIMGYRKTASIPTCNRADKADPAIFQSKIDISGIVAKEAHGGMSSLSKRKNGIVGSQSKCKKLDTISLIELKVTLEEAQGLLRPRIDHIPKVVPIEDFEFEEYEDAPVIGRPTIITKASVGEDVQWAQCDICCTWRRIPPHILPPSGWTCSDNTWDLERSSCIAAQELSTEQLEKLMNTMNSANCKKRKLMKPDPDPGEASDGSPAATLTRSSIRSLSMPKEELSNQPLQHLSFATNSAASKKCKAAELDSAPDDCSDGLHKYTNLGLVGEGETVSTSAQATSSKHPRHRHGCSCIVCIQPPSGKGPKHIPTCTCNVCSTLKRRFQTMMSRRGKKKSEKEAETVQPDQTLDSSQPFDKAEPDAIDPSGNTGLVCRTVNIEGFDSTRKKPSTSPTKGHFDLNIQPEREEELSPHSNPGSMINKFDDAMEETGKMVNEVVILDQSKTSNVVLPVAVGVELGGVQVESCNTKH